MSKAEAKRALVLLAHGARNPDWAAPFRRVHEQVQARHAEAAVELAYLEFIRPDLPEAVRDLAQRGAQEITVVPLFFGQSGHVLRDVPPMIEQLQREFPAISLRLVDAAGEDQGVREALVAYCSASLTGC